MKNIVKKVFIISLLIGFDIQARTQITITGSSTVSPLVSEMAKFYEKSNNGVRIDVQSGGSSRGIADTRKGLAQIGMISRDLKQDEQDLTAITLAKDGICIILNSKNPIQNLASEQIIKIFTGQIRNWKELGGLDKEITVVNKAEGRSTLELFLFYFKLKNSEIKASVIIGDNEQGIKTVAGNPYSIGYVSVGAAEFSAKNGVGIKALPMNGIPATVANIEAKKYPMSRNLNLVISGKSSPEVTELIKFFTSKAVNPIIREQFFVPITN